MITTNELRIGNWIKYDEDGSLFEVTEIHKTGVRVRNKEEETWIEIDQFSGQHLTPKILENIHIESFMPTRVYHVGVFPFVFWVNYGPLSVQVTKLHELQNLYYIFNKEELQFKSTPASPQYQ